MTLEALGMVETKGLVGSIEAADAMVKANAEPSGTKAHTRFIAEHDQWLAVRNQAIEKRERLIRSKEQIRDLSKAF